MFRFLFLLLNSFAVTVVTLGVAFAEQKPEGDISGLVGEWRYRSITVDGKKSDPKEIQDYRMVIGEDGRVAMYGGKNQMVSGRIVKADASKKPGEIDWIVASRSEFDGRFTREVTQKGIFEAGKDRLKLCLTRDAEDTARPSEFASPEGKELVLEELERVQ